MAKSFFGRISSMLGDKSPAAPASTPETAAPEAASTPTPAPAPAPASRPVVKVVPRPSKEEVVDDPERALRQIVKMQFLAAVAPPKPATAMRTQILGDLKTLNEIPSLKSLAKGFSRVASRPDAPVDEIVASISKEPALAVRVLRMANSVEVSSEQRIDHLDVAVQMLGVERVRKAADALFFLNAGSNTSSSLDWRHLWIHALGTAAIAERLEQRVRGRDGSIVYISGLLHDVGKIVLSTLAPDEYKAILIESWKDHQPLEQLERYQLGVDHAEAGVAFARQNQQANSIIDVIKHHGDPLSAETHRFEVGVVSIANYLAKAYGFGFSGSLIQEGGVTFDELPGWDLIAEETGSRPYFVDIEEDMQAFTKKLRVDLSILREN